MIEIFYNGQMLQVQPELTVQELLMQSGVQVRFCAVERNCEIVPREFFPTQKLEAGDQIEVVTLVGGG